MNTVVFGYPFQVYYSGKPSSVGMKQGGNSSSSGSGGAGRNGNVGGAAASNVSGSAGGSGIAAGVSGPSASVTSGRWPELTVTKSPRIVHLAVGHEGQHAVLVSDEGSAFFVGTARRGEDGDASEYSRYNV